MGLPGKMGDNMAEQKGYIEPDGTIVTDDGIVTPPGLYWKQICRIPQYLIMDIGDCGRWECYDHEGNHIDSDDLAIYIEISSGHKILIPSKSRMVIQDDGDISIEILTAQ